MNGLVMRGNKKILTIVGVLAAVLIGGLVIVYSVYALNQNLPGGLDVEAAGSQNHIELHLKYLPAAQVTDNNMSAYYPGNDSSANGKSIRISAGPKGRVCNIDAAALNGRIRVTIAIQGDSVQYNIPISDVCGTDKFYDHTFDFPNGTLKKDPNIDLYRADINVNYKITDNEYPASEKSDLNYKMSLTGDNSGNGDLALRKNGAADQFGMRSSWSNDAANAPSDRLRLAIPFGYHCAINVDDAAERQVKLYDADEVFGDTYMWVEKDDVKLPLDAYGSTSRVDRWEESDKRWKLSGSNNTENVLTIKREYIERGARYELVMSNPGTNVDGRPSPYSTYYVHWNTLSVGIPQDSIYIRGNCEYELRPTISRDQSTYVYYPNIRVDSTMTKSGGGPIPEGHAWEIYAVRFPDEPSAADKDLRNDANNENPCGANVMPSDAVGCLRISSATYTGSEGHSTQFAGGGPDNVGTRLCFFARVQNPTHWAGDDDLWNYSNMECSVSVKKPRVQFLGSDVRVGGNAVSSYYKVQNNNYGSWAEYGMFTSGINSVVSSGNSLRGGNPDDSVAAWNRLTFANTTSPYGNYGVVPTPSSAYTYFRGLPSSGTPLSAATIPNGVYDVGTSIGNTLARLPESRGAGVILRSNGDFRISNDIIVNNSNLSKASDITQVVIVANNIIIDDSVKQVDAWLLTPPNGSINTCRFNGTLASGVCNETLSVNGSIYTNTLMLRRTAGANPPTAADLATPAERFNLRPDAQLWAYTYANKADYAQTDFIQELPPRY